MSVAWGAVTFVVLVLMTAYFVAAEFSYVATPRLRMVERARDGDRRAIYAMAIQRRLSFMLSGAQLGITVTSLLLGVIVEPTLARALRPWLVAAGLAPGVARGIAVVVALLAATAIAMVFGELAPKNLAIGSPDAIALRLARPTTFALRMGSPAIRLFDEASNRLLRAVNIEPAEKLDHAVTAEELAVIIAESGRVGSLTSAQAGLLQRVLDFRALRAADVQLPRPAVVAIPADATCAELAAAASESGLSRFPVIRHDLDDVLGVVVAKDVLAVPYDRRAGEPVTTLLTPPLAVPESALLSPLLGELRAAHSHLALVVDEHGGVTGIVTLEDIVEELVGDIRDEHDPALPAVRALRDGSFVVPGSWRLDECERDTGVVLPDGDYDTLSGLIMAQLGRVPHVGDQVWMPTAHLRVESLDGFAVRSLRLRLRPDERIADALGDTPP